jgi:hypothetical protein
MAEKRKYRIGVPDEHLQKRDDCTIEADALTLNDGHLYLYLEGKIVGIFAPGGWRSIRESGKWARVP